MTLNLARTVLLWDPADPKDFGLDPSAFRAMRVETLEVPYSRIGVDADLVERIAATGADAAIFTRHNGTVGRLPVGRLLAKLRMGYTCICGIDSQQQKEQTKECIHDFLSGHGRVNIPPLGSDATVLDRGPGKGTFSLILDFEQLGGARFGVPRLLPLIESAGIRATFFVTGFMAWLYPEVLERIVAGGHEVGVHGSMHEFLQGRPFEDQLGRISDNVKALTASGPVNGANFIYRMDEVSPRAMVAAGLKYFVLFRQHSYYRSRFIPASCLPCALRTSAGDIIMIPVPAETYGGNYRIIKGMVDSAWKTAVREGVNHISVLMHPFKDGRLDRLPLTRQVLKYLTVDLQLRAVPLNSLQSPDPVGGDAVRVGYRWDGHEPHDPGEDQHHPIARSWWTPVIYHSRRTEDLTDALNSAGCPAVLSAEVSEAASNIWIYPEPAAGNTATVFCDPIVNPRRTALSVMQAFRYTNSITVTPPSFLTDLWGFFIFHLPRTREEVALTLRKIWTKLIGIVKVHRDGSL
ncbi:MAG: polysaccharide deacetylase family protein [Desulfomonilaceae bacterium]